MDIIAFIIVISIILLYVYFVSKYPRRRRRIYYLFSLASAIFLCGVATFTDGIPNGLIGGVIGGSLLFGAALLYWYLRHRAAGVLFGRLPGRTRLKSAELIRWSLLWKSLGAKSRGELVYDDLVMAYAEPQRAYHTFAHIQDCLALFDAASMLAQHPAELEAALWLHDVVYDPRAADNEERSADWAENMLTNGGVSGEAVGRVRALILATKHQALPGDPDQALLVDIDLSILGRDAPAFARYEQQVRREYGHVPEADFRAGRGAILEAFLKRKFIYQTFLFRERYEAQARQNLVRSLAKLRRAQ